jgi:ADP-ribose pyrophosphatase YjhB (NUDIX family)
MPLIAADIIIEMIDFLGRLIVLIEHAYPPYSWAIFGGFVDVGEIIEHTAMQETQEEISINVHMIALLGSYFDPSRDTGGHTMMTIYMGAHQTSFLVFYNPIIGYQLIHWIKLFVLSFLILFTKLQCPAK